MYMHDTAHCSSRHIIPVRRDILVERYSMPLETHNTYGSVSTQKRGTSFSSRIINATTELSIDARGDHVEIVLQEYRETNRTIGASIQLSQEEWQQFKEAVAAAGGKL